ncbi:MAG: putative peptide zinc metalloprotease protein [Chthoniobacter sp.]|jgi:putative peptide zinc metalloprotease protein|nr:putative peptide zinc metalloprotease protein [Chthoniobacter sp.]
MSSAAAPAQEHVVVPPLRGDLIVTKQLYEGRTYYVVKDPISLQYFRLTAEDYFLATLFDGVRDLGAVRNGYQERFPHLRLEYSEDELKERIARFANDLALLQFLSVQGARLKQRYDAGRARKHSGPSFYKIVNNVFFARRSLFDPDELFARMARPLWWIWTRTAHWICTALVLLAVGIVIAKYDRTEAMMSQFFHINNWLLIWVTTILIKSIHELGHGLTCKHFGGEVHEVGVMLLVFTPYFFVNVSDSWVLPERHKRILISAAGIYVELVLAAFATFLWAIVQPGPAQQILYNIMVIASVSTIIFNANPLMRFDGYYIMTDWIEVPNLSTKSRAFVASKVKRLLFGKNYQDQSMARLPLPKKRFGLFYFYAVASYIYGYFVIYKLTRYMAPHLAPFGLEKLASYFSFSAILAWLVMPFWGFMKSLQLKRDDWKPHGRLRRLTAVGGIAMAAFTLLCFFPHQIVIKRAVAIVLADPETVRPEVEGILTEVYVKEGDKVPAHAPLAKLSNREIEQELVAAHSRVEMVSMQMQQAMAREKPAELRALEPIKEQAQKKMEEAQKNVERLTLRSKHGGTVLTRDLELKRGKGLKLNEVFCAIAPLDSMRIKIPLTEQQVRYVKKDQEVTLKSVAFPDRMLRGRITENPVTMIGADMPAAFSSKRTGDVPTALDRQGREIPLERTFEAEIAVDNREGLLRQGMTGRAQIFAGRHLWGKLVFQSLLDLVSLDYRF